MMESPDDLDLALEEGDIGNIVLDDDETSLAQESIGVIEYNRWKDWIVQRKKKLLIYGGITSAVVLVAVVGLVVILSVTLTGSDTSDWNNDYNPPAPGSDPDFDNEPLFWDDGTKYDDGKICLTAEFQLVLDPSKFAPRQKGINEFAAYLESISTFLLPGDEADVNIREQYTLNVDNCVSHYQVRVRDYIDGPRNNTQTVDIKAGVVSSIAEGRNLPFAPAEAYVHPSFQKIERDVHSCDGKFSRETRVASPYNKQYHTCGDLIKMFPGAFTAGKYDKMTPEQLADAEKRTVSSNSGVYWYTNVSRGLIEGGTMEQGNGKFSRWKSDFTLRYSHLEDARKGISAPSAGSEWSLRVYGVNDGLGELDETVIQKISVWYKELVKKFGDYGATKECR